MQRLTRFTNTGQAGCPVATEGFRTGYMLRVKVRALPNAPRSQVVDYRDNTLRIRGKAPPHDGKANAAIVELLSGFFGVARSRVRILRGFTSRDKLVGLESLSEEQLREKLACLE